jgi:PKD repeat protein
MSILSLRSLILILLLSFGACAFAQPSFQTNAEFRAVATFHSLGLYWSPANKGTGQVAQVEYRVAGTTTYQRGLDLWYDLRTPAPSGGSAGEYRGSLVQLQPNTTYDIRLTLSPGGQQFTSQATTWNENFPIGNTITIPAGNLSAPFVINASHSGSASGYTLVTGAGEINGNNLPTGDWQGWAGSCIVIEPGAHHIIFRGLVLRQCKRSGVNLRWTGSGGQTSDIVVEDSEISGFGTNDTDAALHCNYNNNASNEAVRPERLIFQNNKVHSPRISAQSWFHGHPTGANMVQLNFCNGNHVIRHNELYTTNGNFFFDGLGSVNNFASNSANWFSVAVKGAPYADSDLYGNVMTSIYDDGFEVEGAGRNVRVWGNYFDKVFVAVAQANNAMGPLYIWRNVVNVMGGMSEVPVSGSNPAAPDDEARGPFNKAGGRASEWRGGRTYYFHNTLLQPPPSACGGINLPCGAGWAMREDDRDHYNFVSHNNLWIIHKPQQINGQWKHSAITASCSLGSAANQTGCTLSHDMYNNGIVSGATVSTPPNWSNVTPTYATSGGSYPSAASIPNAGNDWTGDFTLQASTTGHGQALALFNFNSQYASPDVGAHQSGTGPMHFGTGATPPPPCLPAQRPTASLAATPTSGAEPLAVSFDASASSAVSPKTITSYVISYGDGTPNGSGVTQNHTYQNAGQYIASLTVTDSAGCTSATPDTETITVTGGPTVTLMQGLNGYTGTTDAHLWGADPNVNRDLVFSIRTEGTSGSCSFCDSEVIRFAIFAAEGGPVPNGATITSATLSLYQFGGPPAVIKASRLLKSFNEQQVTWNSTASGTSWTVGGANGSGTDYVATADGQAQSPDADALDCDGPPADPNQCWVHINVTSGVQAFAGGTANHGWKIAQVSSPIPGNYKNFNASENPGFPNFRPKLTITYTP